MSHEMHNEFTAVIERDGEQAVACHRSPEYQQAAAYRRNNGAGEVEQVIVAGGEATK